MIYHIYSQFKHHKRGWISCKILLGIFILSLFSNFIANDKPIIISYKNHIFFPQLSYLTLEDFGETLPIAVDYNLPAFNKKIYDSGGWVIPSPIPYSLCPMSYVLCPMPYALCPCPCPCPCPCLCLCLMCYVYV